MKELYKLNQTMLDKVIHLLHDSEELINADPSLKEKLELLSFVDAQIRKYPRKRDAAKVIMSNPDKPISKTYAYQLMNEAQYVFGSVSVYDKNYYRNILIEKCLVTLEHCQKFNKIKEINLTIASLIKLFGFDKDEESKINAEMLQQHQFMVMVNFKNAESSYTIDINKLNKMSVEERMKIINEVEAENIEFDLISKIEKEELDAE